MTFEEQFQQAGTNGREFRGAPFWSWNDELDPEELRRQIRSMHDAGMGGFFMHARGGLVTPYMSQEYFDCHRACIDEAKKLGMDAWLYDEDGWPSGAGGGVTPNKGPFYQSKHLMMDMVTGGETESSDRTIAVYRYTSEGSAITDFELVDNSLLQSSMGETLLHCRWVNAGYLDVLSEEAVAQFIDNTHDAFAKVFRDEFGKAIPGIFTDEPNYRCVPWTLDFAKEFKSRMGYDIIAELPLVFFDLPGYRKVRRDFWRVTTELYVEAFSKQIYDWCEDHQMKLTGHQLWEDNLEVQVRHIGAAMPHYEYMQAPGIDHLCRRISDPILVKQVSSVAHQFGGRRVLSEMFGCSGWNMSFEDQKWIGEWQYALGVNLMCQHLLSYSMRGGRKRDYPPVIFYQQPWWPQYKVVEDHFARLACALTMGKHVADVLVIHPMESAWADFDVFQVDEELVRLNNDLASVSSYLQEFHVDYDYGDEGILERHASVEDGQIKVGDASYNLVVLPSINTLRSSTVELLRQWIEAGGKVIACGSLPTMIDGEENVQLEDLLDDLRHIPVDFDALRDAVLDCIEPRVQVLDEYGSDADTIYFQQRDLGGKQLFFFANIDNTDVRYDSVIRFHGSGKVEEWDLDTGEIVELPVNEIGGYTVIEREFAPTQSRLLSFDPTQDPVIGEPERWMVTEEVEIPGPWKLSRKDPNAITLDYCSYSVNGGSFSEPIPAIWLQGRLSTLEEPAQVTVRYTFHTDFTESKPRNFTLITEDPTLFEIAVNGNRISYIDEGWWCDISFKKINIDLYVQPGENVIEMTRHYISELAMRKLGSGIDINNAKSRMWTNPPADVQDPILLPYGGELAEKIKESNRLQKLVDIESIYILGDFAVYRDTPGRFVLRDEEPTVQAGDMVEQGYPFFRGTLVYESSFEYKDRDQDKLLLTLDRMGGIIADVFVNGQNAGKLKWRPLEIDISSLVKPGQNCLRIELTNSCHNLLGPHHNTEGEIKACHPGSFGGLAGYAGVDSSRFKDAGERELQQWTDNYNFVETGLLTSPKLTFMRKE